MEILLSFIDLFLNLDKHLNDVIIQYGTLTYFILFAIIFCETGLVVTPFLPGDSLLFAAGAIAALGSLDVVSVCGLLISAAILGDSTNYFIGRTIGPKIFAQENVRFLNKQHLARAHEFYEKHGGKTVIFARFMPILRTFAPFVAGLGSMSYRKFISYSVFGSIIWISTFTLGGFYFGNIPIVKNNFTLVILAILVLSVMPAVIEFIKHRKKK